MEVTNIKKLEILAERYKEKIDGEIMSSITEDIPTLRDAVLYHLGTGGKRLRPMMCLAASKALGIKISQILPLAAACELIHNAYLIHDDIEDGDKVRRDKPAVWVKYGLAHGINTADYMLSKVLELILKCEKKGVGRDTVMALIKQFADTNLHTTEGQSLDIDMRENGNPTEEEYLHTIMKKTGYYLISPIVGAAIFARLDEKNLNAIIDYGKKIGLAFQIQDDIIDLTVGKGRCGEIGNDVKEGKRTLMVCYVAQRATKAEQKRLFKILNKRRECTTTKDIQWVIQLYKRYKAIDYAKQKQMELTAQAKNIINSIDPRLRPLLSTIADYIIERER